MVEAQQPAARSDQIPDNVLQYASVFTYEKSRIRNQLLQYRVNYSAIESYESKSHI